VHEWILASEALIHFNCTTGIEAYYLDVPAISFRRPGHEAFHQPLPNHLSHICNDTESLMVLLDAIIKKGQAFPGLLSRPDKETIAGKYIEGMHGAFASERIVRSPSRMSSRLVSRLKTTNHQCLWSSEAWRRVLKVVRQESRAGSRRCGILSAKVSRSRTV
jgi:hypothetical protein